MGLLGGCKMYEKFDDEKRAIFRDIDNYARICNLWRSFSRYLLARHKGYDNYGRIQFGEYSISGHRWVWRGSSDNTTYHTGMVVYKHRKYWFGKKIAYLDLYDLESSCMYPKLNLVHATPDESLVPILCGIDLDYVQEFDRICDLLDKATANIIVDTKASKQLMIDRFSRP